MFKTNKYYTITYNNIMAAVLNTLIYYYNISVVPIYTTRL